MALKVFAMCWRQLQKMSQKKNHKQEFMAFCLKLF